MFFLSIQNKKVIKEGSRVETGPPQYFDQKFNILKSLN
jgi:hypothetical protein